MLAEPQAFGASSALTLGLDGTPYLSLFASSAPNSYAIFRAPTDATDATDVERVSDLPLCRGDDLEVVKALPAPEPAGAAAAVTALACLALLGWCRPLAPAKC